MAQHELILRLVEMFLAERDKCNNQSKTEEYKKSKNSPISTIFKIMYTF